VAHHFLTLLLTLPAPLLAVQPTEEMTQTLDELIKACIAEARCAQQYSTRNSQSSDHWLLVVLTALAQAKQLVA
jgi:hypothetical protein